MLPFVVTEALDIPADPGSGRATDPQVAVQATEVGVVSTEKYPSNPAYVPQTKHGV